MIHWQRLVKQRWIAPLLILFTLSIGVGLLAVSLFAQSDELSFGYDRGIQFVDPDGRNEAPFWINGIEATVDFTLYSLTDGEFISRYRTYQPWQPPPINVSGLPTVTTWQQHFAKKDPWLPQPVQLPTNTVPSGLYVIQAVRGGGDPVRSLIAVGRHTLILKRGSGGQVVAWAARLQTGEPLNAMNVTLYDNQGNPLASSATGSDGIATFAITNGDPWLAIGHAGDEVTIAGLDWQWRTNDDYWYGNGYEQASYRIYLHTERPIYRPGDTIFYNAVVRHNLANGYSPISTSQPLSLTLRDSRGNVVETQVKTADEFGALAGEFLLGQEPPLGNYTLEIQAGAQAQQQRLRVEEYRKPEYEVKVLTPADFAIAGDAIPITVEADYFFGQPVAKAVVTLQIYRQPYYWYNYWWWYGHVAPNPNQGLLTELTGVTDQEGRWQTIFTPDAIEEYNAIYTFKATVTDARDQPVEHEKSITLYWNTFKLEVHTDRYGYEHDEAVTIHVAARGHAEQPVANQRVELRIVRDDWQSNTATDVVPPQTVNTDGQGKAQAIFSTVPQGWHRIIASSTDGRGRKVESYSYLWVYDTTSDSWWYWNNDDLSITTDKESYAPGETATLLIQSRITGVALVTLERAGVHREMIVPINRPMTTVEALITADLAPNVYAKVHIFKRTAANDAHPNAEGRLVTAKSELVVPALDKRLKIEIAANAPAYKPGEQATLTLRVTDAGGQPVRARVSLALVDEAIFALQADLSANLFDAFYGRRLSSVQTYDSLVRHPYNYFYGVPSEDGGSGPTPTPVATQTPPGVQTPNNSQPRRIFLDTAYWNPNLVTNDAGEVRVAIRLPDNLTTWRVIARAVTLETQVGEDKAQLLVTQEIIARPALPRFAVLGDRFHVGIVAQNFSGSDTSGSAELASNQLLLLDAGARPLSLPNVGTAVAKWTAVASQVGAGLVTSTVSTGNGQDVVELPLSTKAFAAPDRWTASGQANPTASAVFTAPFNAVNEASQLTVHLAPSLALGLLDGLDELIDFPYGCVEQTMSRLLPSAVAAKAYADLGIPNPKADELPEMMSQGLQKLYGFQHQDGGWGWFYDDDGAVQMTTYVLFGLVSVQEAGFTVDANVLMRGFTYLDGALAAASDPDAKAFALYVKALAQRGDLPAARALVAQADQMDADGLAALALALHLGGDSSNAQTVLDKLISRARTTPSWVFWPVDEAGWDWYNWQSMASTEKYTALALRALVTLRSDSLLTPKVVRWLMDHRNGAGWGGYGSANTQATAFAVIGLADYIQVAGELQPNYNYTVQFNGQIVASGQVKPANARQPIPPIVIAGSQLQTGENKLHIERDSNNGQLYYSVLLNQQLFYDGFAEVTSLDQGLALKRSYQLSEGAPRKDGAYNLGDLVEVTIELEANQRMSYVLVEDPIPAGFEALAERVNPYGWGGCPFCEYADHFFWREWGYNRKDVRDDRVDFFLTELWPGKHTFTYLMRATTRGEFSVLPGQAYPMYNDDIWGRSASQQVVVAPEQLIDRPTLAGDFDRDCRISAFDARQVAGVYGATNPLRNLVGDTRIQLADVVSVAQRVGARCLADKGAPGQGSGAASFLLTATSDQVIIGQPFDLQVTSVLSNTNAAAANGLGGFGLRLQFDPHKMKVAKVTWNPALGKVTPLGPTINHAQGVVAFGLLGLPAGADLLQPLATITFIGQGVGNTIFNFTTAEAVDSQGQLISASAQAGQNMIIDGEQTFLPFVLR
jgi:hypothetical protein